MMNSVNFFVGSYTQVADHVKGACGKGIYSCELNLIDGSVELKHMASGLDNPAYLAIDEAQEKLLVVSENFNSLSSVHSYQLLPNQQLLPVHALGTHGVANCHLSLHKEYLFSAAYGSGNLDVYRLNDGLLSHEALLSYQGSGPNLERQEMAHAHQALASPDGRWLYVCDLGSDRVWCHDLQQTLGGDDASGIGHGIPMPAGSGPRHLVFHPHAPFVYVVCELNAQVQVCQYEADTGVLTVLESIDSLPASFSGKPSAAALKMHPTGKALYVSNRQHNSFSTFSVGEDGRLSPIACLPSEGAEPRDLSVDPTGQFLLLANQDSNTIVVYRLDPQSGSPSTVPVYSFACDTPVCIVFADL
jgi:6-phosphogluconolactonase